MSILAEGERLRLRRAGEADVAYIMALQYQPENIRYIVPFSRDVHQATVAAPPDDADAMDVIVEERATDEAVGYLRIAGLKNAAHEVEWTHVVIEKKGHGYGHEAMKLLKKWSFGTKGAHRAWLDCKDYNERALHLYESEGMQREGLIRETILTGGVYENLVILGILDREYEERKAKGQELA